MDHYYTNNNLPSEVREIKYNIFDSSFVFYSNVGVFSKNKIDYASDLLIKTFLNNNKKTNMKILDVGCGYGVIGIVVSLLTNSTCDLIDVNDRCVHLTNRNIKKLKVNGVSFNSDAYENVKEKYDLIITNPPIRVGNKKLLEILNDAKDHLKKNGSLWFVINKNQGALTIKKIIEKNYFVEIIDKSKGFYIFKAKIIDNL